MARRCVRLRANGQLGAGAGPCEGPGRTADRTRVGVACEALSAPAGGTGVAGPSVGGSADQWLEVWPLGPGRDRRMEGLRGHEGGGRGEEGTKARVGRL